MILIAYPIAACFVYLMVEPWDVHAVMTFGQAFAFALVVWFIDKYPEDRTKVEGALCKAAVALLGVLVTLNIRYSNILYLKADVMQTQMISYYTTLITRIESIEGYTEDAQVVYIGEYDKHDKNLVGISEYFDDLDLATYKGEPIFNDYAWKEAMEFWCGFAPELGDAAEFDGNAEVASMPCYPDQGSIRCINGKLLSNLQMSRKNYEKAGKLNEKLSLIISVYNEEAVLEKFYKAFCSIEQNLEYGGGGYELIFVNDGSTDASMNILEVIAQQNKNVRVISFSRNFGHEAAMIAGIDHAAGDVIICMDADLQHPLECIAPIMAKFEEGYEVISMVRTSNKSAGAIKNFTSRAFYRVINALSDQVKLEENASDFFAISSRVADVLRTNYREKLVFYVDMYKALVSGKQRWNTLLRKELAVPATIR